jgi:hypothetical protein
MLTRDLSAGKVPKIIQREAEALLGKSRESKQAINPN